MHKYINYFSSSLAKDDPTTPATPPTTPPMPFIERQIPSHGITREVP